MEHNGSNQNLAATLCRAGCGFYANAAFEGMCSKCYKDAVKRRQQNNSTSQVAAGRISPAVTSSDVGTSTVDTSVSSLSLERGTTPSIDTATTTVPSASNIDKSSTEDKAETSTAAGAEGTSGGKDKEGAGDKKPKKNRCHTCKKKVGLTGFECRCGGLFCSLHRYSDKHDCTFNYKEMAQEQIRKNNPVVVGEKIQKI